MRPFSSEAQSRRIRERLKGEDAEAIIERGDADLVAFGRHFIANPSFGGTTLPRPAFKQQASSK